MSTTEKREIGQEIRDNIQERLSLSRDNTQKSLLGLPRYRGTQVVDSEHQETINALLNRLSANTRLHMDNLTGTLRYLRGDLMPLTENSNIFQTARRNEDHGLMAIAVVSELSEVMQINSPIDEFEIDRVEKDDIGMTHVVLQQTYKGIPIWRAQVGVHLSKELQPREVSGLYIPTPNSMPEIAEEITRAESIEKAKKAVNMQGAGLEPIRVDRVIYWDLNRTPIMTYRVSLVPKLTEEWQIFVASRDGRVVHRYRTIQHEAVTVTESDLLGNENEVSVWQDNGTFYAIDTTTSSYDLSSMPPAPNRTRGAVFALSAGNTPENSPQELFFVTTANPEVWDPTAISVLNNFHLVETYFKNMFNRNSINDAGMAI